MTLGKRIQKFRKLSKISGADLAMNTGISHTVIRKYETDRTLPKKPQIDVISDALNVSPYSIIGNEYTHRLKTIGDLFGILIILYDAKIIEFNGIRDTSGKLIPPISCTINEQVKKLMDIDDVNATININNLLFTNDVLNDFLNWEMYNDRLNAYVNRYREEHFQEKEYIDTIKNFIDCISEYEIKLMYCQNEINNF